MQREGRESGAETAQRRLTLPADIEQTGLKRQRHREPGEHVVGRVEQRVADALRVAERAAQQDQQRPSRRLADDHYKHGDRSEPGARGGGGDQQGMKELAAVRKNRRTAPWSGVGAAIAGVDRRRPVALDNAAPDEIQQMGMDRSAGGAVQPRPKTDIKPVDDRLDPLRPGGEAIEDAGLALAAMGDKGVDMRHAAR